MAFGPGRAIDVGLIVRAISFQDLQSMSQTDRWTDNIQSQYRTVHNINGLD